MTSTSVKDVGSLLNFVGSQTAISTAKTGSTNSFGDVMNQASYSDRNSAVLDKAGKEKSRELSGSKVNKAHPRKEALKTDTSKGAKPEEAVADQEQAVAEAGNEIIRETAKELDVSEEEVIGAMEELGFEITDLFDAENLTKLALALSGEENSLVLLTDEGLYGKVQNLLQGLAGIQKELMEEMSVSPEELEQILADMDTAAVPESGSKEVLAELPLQETGKEDHAQSRVTVTVEESTQTVKLATDENGNTVGVEEVTAKEETKQDSSDKQSKGGFDGESTKKGFESMNPVLDTLLKSQAQETQAAFEQMAASAAPDTEEIMNQILDYMKIQLKPGMDQLEMQLHPESLGTLHIQLTSKGGEVTAQFQVQNETVKAAIESQLTILKDNLRDLGIKVEAVEVTVESHAFESNLWQGQQRDGGSAYQNSKKAQRRINLNALDDGFEEEADEEELLAAEMMRVNGGTVDYTA